MGMTIRNKPNYSIENFIGLFFICNFLLSVIYLKFDALFIYLFHFMFIFTALLI